MFCKRIAMQQEKVEYICLKLSETLSKIRTMVLEEYNVEYITQIPDERFKDVCDFIKEAHQDLTMEHNVYKKRKDYKKRPRTTSSNDTQTI